MEKNQRQLKGNWCTLVSLEPPVCLSSQNDHLNTHEHHETRTAYTRQPSSLPPASLDFIKFQWKLALCFIRNQVKDQYSSTACSCSGRGRNPYFTHIYISFFFGLCCTLTVKEEETGVPPASHYPCCPHAEGCNQNRPAIKLHLLHVMEKDNFWMVDCSKRLLFTSHKETITHLQGKSRLPVWKTRELEKQRDLSTQVRHTLMGKVLNFWYKEYFYACKHLITLHLLDSPLLKSLL